MLLSVHDDEIRMNRIETAATSVIGVCVIISGFLLSASTAYADSYTDTIGLFKEARSSAQFFRSRLAYTVFPTIGKGGFFWVRRAVRAGCTVRAVTSVVPR